MSDGPHRSLPMKGHWRAVVLRADKTAYSPEELREAVDVALVRDCRAGIRPWFLDKLRRMGEEPVLFKEAVLSQVEALRPDAAPGMERAVLDNLECLSDADMVGFNLMQQALAGALDGAFVERKLQLEEHTLRETNQPRATNLRGRLEDARGCRSFEVLAGQFLTVDPKQIPRKLKRREGLDDGVKL